MIRVRCLADANQASRHHRIRRQRAARRIDLDLFAQPHRVAQDQLLVRERRVELGHVDRTVAEPAFCAASAEEADFVRSRAPSECASIR